MKNNKNTYKSFKCERKLAKTEKKGEPKFTQSAKKWTKNTEIVPTNFKDGALICQKGETFVLTICLSNINHILWS